jgi:hypothetical protein
MSSEPTRIEKRSLEAHVELCAKRYTYLEAHLDNLNNKITKVEKNIDQVLELVQDIERKQSDRTINWGVGIITSLLGVIAWLATTYVFK